MYVVNGLVSLTEIKLCLDKLRKMNFIEFSWILINCGFYRNWCNSGLAPLSENAGIGDYYQGAKFHACLKKCTIHLKFQAMPPDYSILYFLWEIYKY